jgi:hypothetical protein
MKEERERKQRIECDEGGERKECNGVNVMKGRKGGR